MTLSPRDSATLYAISRLPLGGDGWRRAAYRDQLHELAGFASRGPVARALKGALNGLVVTQGVGRSAGVPEGYKLTDEGENLARLCAPSQAEPVPSQPPEPVLGSGSMSFSGEEKEELEPTNQTGPRASPSQGAEPGSEPVHRIHHVHSLAPETLQALLLAMGYAPTPSCGCKLPMVKRKQRKPPWAPFWSCVKGKRPHGCGLTLDVDEAPAAQQGRLERMRAEDEAPGPRPFDEPGALDRILGAAAKGLGLPGRTG